MPEPIEHDRSSGEPGRLFAAYEPRPVRPAGEFRFLVRPSTRADGVALARLIAAREGRPEASILAGLEAEFAAPSREQHLVVAAKIDGAPGPGEAEVIGFARAGLFTPPEDAAADVSPAGYYLKGVIVDPAARRRGVAHALTRARLDWIAARANHAWYFCNAANRASIDLHASFGFVEVTRAFSHPRVSFEGGVGILFRARLR